MRDKNVPAGGYQVQVLDRVVAILDSFQNEKAQLGVTELSKKLGLHKSTVHRLLEALRSYRLIAQDSENEKYSLGLKLFELGNCAVASIDIHKNSMPVLKQLVAATGETAHLCILDDKQVLYLEKFESERTLRIPSRVGQRNPSHCTAVGKALLAFLPEELNSLCKTKALKRSTENTITDPVKLRQELASVRRQGFALDNEEIELGLRCVAAPVRDYGGRVIAAISIAGPSFRITEEKFAPLAESVTRAASALSEKMGYQDIAEPAGRNGHSLRAIHLPGGTERRKDSRRAGQSMKFVDPGVSGSIAKLR